MSKNRLSHSAASMYQTCGYKYKLHYKDKLRSKYTSAALLFGSALDKALDAMLKDHNTLEYDQLLQKYQNIFNIHWREAEINGVKQELISNVDIVYAASDLDFKLLGDKDYLYLIGLIMDVYRGAGTLKEPTVEAVQEFYKALLNKKETSGWENMSEPERQFYNHLNWMSLARKGYMMILAYHNQIMPKIKRVLTAQEKISVTNDTGDEIIGFVDFVAEWEDGRIVVFDNKTSARDYEADAVLKSPQLTLYTHALESKYGTRHAGFVVLKKTIRKDVEKKCAECGTITNNNRLKTCGETLNGKRCGGNFQEVIKPSVDIQVLINEVPEQVENLVMENYMEINHAIKQEVYTRNLNACDSPFPCPFKNVCWKNSMKDVIKLEDK